MQNWDERKFQKWMNLRAKFYKYKKGKDWQNLINVCNEIISLGKEAKFIGIMIPLFYKAVAKAYEQMVEIEKSLEHYKLAKDGFIQYRNENKLNSQDDWLKDIHYMDRKIAKLLQKRASLNTIELTGIKIDNN